MTDRLKLNEVQSAFESLEYPATRDAVAERFEDTTLALADGETNLGRVVSEVPADSFSGPDDLFAELNNALPVEAVGEPGQSEGDA
jgi:hypothetical protein